MLNSKLLYYVLFFFICLLIITCANNKNNKILEDSINSYNNGNYRAVLINLNYLHKDNTAITNKLYELRGKSYYQLNNFDSAIVDFEYILSLDSFNNGIRLYKAICEVNTGDTIKALYDYNLILDNDVKFTEAYFRRAELYSIQNKLDLAIADYIKAIAIDSNSYLAYNGLGVIYDKCEKYYSAIDCYTKSLLINPNQSIVYYNRGVSLANINSLNQSINDFNLAIKITPDYSNFYLAKGQSYLLLNNIDSAFVNFDMAYKLGNIEAKEYIHQYINKYY